MTAEQHLRDGNIALALQELKQRIRLQASDPKLRIFLFQLLAVQGDWIRALNQLAVLHEIDAASIPMAQVYRNAIECEAFRVEVFSGAKTPLLFGEPQPWMAFLVEALALEADGHGGEAQKLRHQAFDLAPVLAGKVDGTAFSWIADADPRLGPMLEMVVNGKYFWVPWLNIKRLDFEPPSDLRDLVWMPVHVTWKNDGESVALVPTRYPGTLATDDPALRLARKTDWLDQGDGRYWGVGQRILVTDVDEYPMLEIRTIELDG